MGPSLPSPDTERFKAIAALKDGRFSAVSLLRDRSTDTLYVGRLIKIPQDINPAVGRAMLDRHVDLLAHLQHKRLPRFRQRIDTPAGTWLLFDYVDGYALSRFTDFEADIPPPWIVIWLYEILEGLHVLHCQTPPIYVGSIEPSDIIITPEGAVITDIGVVQTLFPEQAAMFYRPNIHFVAPEKRHAAFSNARTDIFSAASIAYWMLTGHAPVVMASQPSVMLVREILDARPDLPAEIAEIVAAMVQFQPGERPATVAHALQMLGSWMPDIDRRQLPSPPRPDDTRYSASTTRKLSVNLQNLVRPPDEKAVTTIHDSGTRRVTDERRGSGAFEEDHKTKVRRAIDPPTEPIPTPPRTSGEIRAERAVHEAIAVAAATHPERPKSDTARRLSAREPVRTQKTHGPVRILMELAAEIVYTFQNASPGKKVFTVIMTLVVMAGIVLGLRRAMESVAETSKPPPPPVVKVTEGQVSVRPKDGNEWRKEATEVGRDDFVYNPRGAATAVLTFGRKGKLRMAAESYVQVHDATYDIMRATVFRGQVIVSMSDDERAELSTPAAGLEVTAGSETYLDMRDQGPKGLHIVEVRRGVVVVYPRLPNAPRISVMAGKSWSVPLESLKDGKVSDSLPGPIF